jgi:hypothetical protein
VILNELRERSNIVPSHHYYKPDVLLRMGVSRAVLRCAVLCCAVLCCVMSSCVVFCHAVKHSTVISPVYLCVCLCVCLFAVCLPSSVHMTVRLFLDFALSPYPLFTHTPFTLILLLRLLLLRILFLLHNRRLRVRTAPCTAARYIPPGSTYDQGLVRSPHSVYTVR